MQTKNDILACIAAGPSAIQLLASQFFGEGERRRKYKGPKYDFVT
jgi:hypothetical protein